MHAADSLAAIPPPEWDAIASVNGYYLSHRWLSSVEADSSARAEYLLARHQGRLVAALPLYDVLAERNEFYQPARLVDGRWTGRYLIAGSRRAYSNGLLVHPGLDSGMRAQAVGALLGATEQRVRSHAADGALFVYLPTDAACELRLASAVATAASVPLLTAADSAIELPGSCFDDYLGSFSPRRRRKLQHEIAVFERAGYEMNEEQLADCWAQAGALLANLQRRYGHPGDDERWRSALQRQAEALGDHGVVFGCRRKGALVGFCLAYPFGDTLYVRLAGFDYPALRSAFEYFNIVFYQPLRYLYRHGLRRLHLGRESYDAKVRRGATLAPLWSLAVFEQDAPDARAAVAWNRQVSVAWINRYGRKSRALAHPGWAMWGCGDPV